jgi:S1-C subfamily serine protease
VSNRRPDLTFDETNKFPFPFTAKQGSDAMNQNYFVSTADRHIVAELANRNNQRNRTGKPRFRDALIVFALMATVLAVMALCQSPARGQQIIQFTAPAWCQPCREVEPIVASLARSGLPIKVIDIDQQADEAARYGFNRGTDHIPMFVAVDVSGKRVGSAVVGVQSESTLRAMYASVAKPAQPEKTQANNAAHCRIAVADGSWGSGTLVEVDGDTAMVITCSHLFDDSRDGIVCHFSCGSFQARLIDIDKDSDLAALQIKRPNVEPLAIDDSTPTGPLTVCGYGSPEKNQFRQSTASIVGWVSPGSTNGKCAVIQTAARSGDSGGAVLNANGAMVGVVWGSLKGQAYLTCDGQFRQFIGRVLPSRRNDRRQVSPTAPPTPQPATQSQNAVGEQWIQWRSEVEAKLAALQGGKQDRGDYLTAGQLPKPYTPPTDLANRGYVEDRLKSVCTVVDTKLSETATKADIKETHTLIDRVLPAVKDAVEVRLNKLPVSTAAGVATHILGVPTWIAAPIGLIGGPVGVAASIGALIAFRRLSRRMAGLREKNNSTVAGGPQSDRFPAGLGNRHQRPDVPVAGQIGPRDRDGRPMPGHPLYVAEPGPN